MSRSCFVQAHAHVAVMHDRVALGMEGDEVERATPVTVDAT